MSYAARLGFAGEPSRIDQTAASLVVALDDNNFKAAAELLRPFSPFERIGIGMKAIAAGADPGRVADAAAAAAGEVPQDDPEIEIEVPGSRPPTTPITAAHPSFAQMVPVLWFQTAGRVKPPVVIAGVLAAAGLAWYLLRKR